MLEDNLQRILEDAVADFGKKMRTSTDPIHRLAVAARLVAKKP